MAYAFVVEKMHTVAPAAPDIAMQRTTFDIVAALDGQRIIFRCSWNGYHQFYSIDILNAAGVRIKKWYPKVGEEITIRNWNANSPDRPDIELRVVDTTGQDAPFMPSTFGKSHVIMAFIGRVKEL